MKIKFNKNKSGFTLVEVVAALVLLVILVGSAAAILLSGQKLYAKNANSIKAMDIANETFRILNNRVKYSTNLIISASDETASGGLLDNSTESGKKQYPYVESIRFTKNGDVQISRNGSTSFTDVLDKGKYKVILSVEKMPVGDSAKKLNSMSITINIIDSRDSSIAYTISSDTGKIELLNFKSGSTFFPEGDVGEQKDKYTVDNTSTDLYFSYSYIE